ncbi:hypothetical protein LJC68_04000 [Bacteroidales bacterium OttesenSCG-928-B11]|nr:hypothetical protein [Bacteroidales bacterium OttesenSCG-928-C03]MDL2312022.1 hypothetical protein [Bacteroidales bacterium OttesenSCG-928-B11]
MKKLIVSIIALFLCTAAFSQTYVSGYYKSNGTYVQPHYRTTKDNTNHNNWSTSGNTNIYTGTKGSVAKDYSPQATNYGQGKTIYTGSQGGQYYYNSNNNKTYIPKQPSSTNYYRTSSKSSYKSSYRW